MQYLFLAYGDENQLAAMSSSERAAFEDACLANVDWLRKSGHLLAAAGLQGRHTVATVRVLNDRVALTAAPIGGKNETLSELFFIEARDLNDAIQVAAQLPQARCGPIEVWPMTEFVANRSSHSQ